VENAVSLIENSLKNTFPLLRKKRDCQKGVLMYSDQDKQHLLKYVEKVIPSSKEDWEKIEKLFNNKYTIFKKRPIRTLNSIKTKFREIAHSTLTGGGKKDEFEKKAKKLQKEIDKKCGIINDTSKDNKSDTKTSESEVTSIKLKNSLGRPIKMNFKKHVMSYMSQQAEMAQKRHNEKMNLLHTIFFDSPHSSSSSSFSSSLNKNSF
jgi:hypothetical protein